MIDRERQKMTASERRLSVNLATLFSIRMLGIFIILPIYAEFVQNELHVTGFLAGLFISSYAITQLIIQPVIGALSDRVGRKIMIYVGLSLFILGSIIIAFSSDIYMAIFGRIIQGSGAISAVILALATDLSRAEIRSKMMAIIGVSIGVTFGISIILSTLIYGLFQGIGIFLFCALVGAMGILIAYYYIPSSVLIAKDEASHENMIKGLMTSFNNTDINRLYFGSFMLHLILTASFTGFPFFLNSLGYGTSNYGAWKIYLPSFMLSLILMFILVGLAERYYQHRRLFLGSIVLLIIAFIIMLFNLAYWSTLLAMLLFFVGFNALEATQPSLISRFIPEHKRGMMMGIFSSAQFLGASVGGVMGSMLYSTMFNEYSDIAAFRSIFVVNIILLIGWFMIAYSMNNPIRKEYKV